MNATLTIVGWASLEGAGDISAAATERGGHPDSARTHDPSRGEQ